MSNPTCARCERPDPTQGYICLVCSGHLRRDLALAASLAGEAQTTIARLAQLGAAGRSGEPLPFSWDAANGIWSAANTFTTWARHCAEERGIALPTVRSTVCAHRVCQIRRQGGYAPGPVCEQAYPQHPLAVICDWLVTQLDWIRHRPEADEAFDELSDACRMVERTVDRPPAQWCAGTCGVDGCEARLYTTTGAAVVRCRECSAEHDADERREQLLDDAADVLGNATWLAGTVTQLGHPVAASTVRTWAERGRLLAHGTDTARSWPLYRLGDVVELVVEAEIREVQREARAKRPKQDSAAAA